MRFWLCETAERWLRKDPNKKDEEIGGADQRRLTSSNEIPVQMKLGVYRDKVRERITGNRYGRNENDTDAYKVRSKKYYYYYIGHYDPVEYQKRMLDYKNGRRKSKPNGRTWCKLPKKIDPHSLTRIN